MILSQYTLKNVSTKNVDVPLEVNFELPEKVLQFGTGVLLRGLPDYFINKANQQGIFNGRVVIVKSTSKGDSASFEKQDGLYTLCIRGLQNGENVEDNSINASISRVLSAKEDWEHILKCAHDQNMQIIISNTTEVGIKLVNNDDIHRHPPVSYPGKLLAFLYERYQAFNGSEQSGMVIIPTELIPDNGKVLESIVLELAHLNGLDDKFIEWLERCNHFCTSLVDRIVTGKPDAEIQAKLEKELGYKDELLIMSEVYGLWAIEGDENIKNILSFAQADEGVKIELDIKVHRELKLRLLNGTHTLSCALAFIAGCETVKEAMDDDIISGFISGVMEEIIPDIPCSLDPVVSKDFGNKVADRFRNPNINHLWINITVQISSKMKLRCIPLLANHYKHSPHPPELFALGFAAYIYFMKVIREDNGKYYGELNGKQYQIQDDSADVFMKRWEKLKPADVVKEVLNDTGFWGEPLYEFPNFQQAVTDKLNLLINSGAEKAMQEVQSKKEFAHEQ